MDFAKTPQGRILFCVSPGQASTPPVQHHPTRAPPTFRRHRFSPTLSTKTRWLQFRPSTSTLYSLECPNTSTMNPTGLSKHTTHSNAYTHAFTHSCIATPVSHVYSQYTVNATDTLFSGDPPRGFSVDSSACNFPSTGMGSKSIRTSCRHQHHKIALSQPEHNNLRDKHLLSRKAFAQVKP